MCPPSVTVVVCVHFGPVVISLVSVTTVSAASASVLSHQSLQFLSVRLCVRACVCVCAALIHSLTALSDFRTGGSH